MLVISKSAKSFSRIIFLCVLFACICLLYACEKKTPLKIGYVGGLTGRVADLGIAGRDGATLAVEEINKTGGLQGRQVVLLVKDDRQDAETAVKVGAELIAEGVAAIIGHMTSSMSIAVLPQINEKKVVMISPTTSTNELSGMDDYFFRVYPASAQAAKLMAELAYERLGLNNLVVLYDINNMAYTESLYLNFKLFFERHGGTLNAAITYSSGSGVSFTDIAADIAGRNPDGLLILANAMDTAMLCQQLAKMKRQMPIITGEWSATEDILQFGGKAVEGIHFFHTFDKENKSPGFIKFKEAFSRRFGYEAGFASAHAYDSAMLILEALKKNDDPSALRQTLKNVGSVQGVQTLLKLDDFGDIDRKLFLMTIKDGRFERAD